MSSKQSRVALREDSKMLPASARVRRRRARAMTSSVARFGVEHLEARVVMSGVSGVVAPDLTVVPGQTQSYWPSFSFGIQAAAPPAVQFVDDLDAGYANTGTWGHSVEPDNYYGDDHSYARGGHGADVATYTFTGLDPGIYRVSATWRGDVNRAGNAPYSVYDGTNLLGTYRLNQQLQPNSRTDAGFSFGDVGTTWTVTGPTLVVTLSDDADYYVDSDAVRIERVSGLPAPAPYVTVSLDGTTQASGSSIVDFGGTHPGAPVTKTFTVKNIGQQALHLGQIDSLPDGYSLVSGFGAGTLNPGESTTMTVLLNASTTGTFGGALAFHSDDPAQGLFSLAVNGVVTDEPAPVLAGFTDTLVAAGLGNNTSMSVAPDGRIFVSDQNGTLHVIENGNLLSTPFMTLSVNSAAQRGLLGVAFDPDFANNQYVYVYYTLPDSHNRITRFTANGNVVDPASEYVVLDLDPAGFIHMGGGLAFGADGKLYVGVGDSDLAGDAQDMGSLFGKILRLNSDGSIPSDNPFFDTATGMNRAIYALGFRNPTSISVQPGTGKIFATDLSESNWEEINEVVAGGNYGWATVEGPGVNPGLIEPVFAYPRAAGATAITGGAFYNPAAGQFPGAFTGGFFFTDLGGGFIRVLNPADGTVKNFATGLANPVAIAVDADGSVLYLSRGGLGDAGEVHRITYHDSTDAPTIAVQPGDKTSSSGTDVTFTVVGAGKAPMTYQWSRNGFDIPGATGPSITLNSVTPGDNGATFKVVVTNGNGAVESTVSTLTVTSNQFPLPTILTPLGGSLYAGGQTITFLGDGTDTEDGTLPDSAFTWKIDFYTTNGVFPLGDPITGVRGGTFVVPDHISNTTTDVFYRITLSVTDSFGQTTSVFRDIQPQTAIIHLAANVPGVTLVMDDQPHAAPYTSTGVTGIVRTLGAPDSVTINGMLYVFSGWSDTGGQVHDVTTPFVETTYTANYTIANVQYVDNADAGYAQTGAGWGLSFEPGKYFLNDHSYATGGAGANFATYTFTGLQPGKFRISATWHGDTNRATNTPFTISDGGSILGTVRLNQQLQPSSLIDQGFGFQDIGGPYNVSSGTLVIKMSDDANQYIDADSIRVERIGDLAVGPEIQVLDGAVDVASGSSTVDLGTTLPGAPVQRVITVKNTGNATLTLGAIGSMPAGFTLVNGFGSTILAAGASTTFTIQLNSPSAGVFSGLISFTSDDADEGNFSFGVTGNVAVVATTQIVDDRDTGFTYVGTFGYSVEGGLYYGNDHSYAIGGNGVNVATYKFNNVAPGLYRISATWRGDTNRASNSPFTIVDGVNVLGTVRMNQQLQPGAFVDQGSNWADIGNFNVTSGTLLVRLSDDANQYIDADAVRIERIGNVVTGPKVTVADGPTTIVSGVSTIDFGSTFPGTPKQKVITVSNTGNAPLTLGAFGALPPGFTLAAGFGSTTLAPGASTTFTLQLNSASAGAFGGNVTFVDSDTNTPTFSFAVSGAAAVTPTLQYVDDRDTGFAVTGNFGRSVEGGKYYGDDHSYAPTGVGNNFVTYTFTGLPPGQYRVSATWRGDTNRATNSPFTVLDGATPLATVRINQQLQPSSLFDKGFGWSDLGGPYNVTSGTLVVKLSDDANQYVDADAVRIERIGNVVTGPEIQVLDGTSDLTSGTGTVDFGTTTPGAPPQKTLTVKNIGTSALNLGAIGAMPAGFTLVTGFGSTTLAPGASTTFVIKMNATSVGTFGGTFSFANDDADEGTFGLNLTGKVAAGSAVRIIDDNDTGFSKVGTWGTSVEAGKYYGNDHTYAQGSNGVNAATYTFTGLAPGTYRVSATWRGDTNRSNAAPFTISDGSSVLGVINVNQQQQPNSLTDQGSNWGDLGTFDVTGSTLIVTLRDTAAAFAYVDADAVRVERISDIGVPPPAPTVFYVDDRGAGWSSVGNWGFSAESIYYNGGHSYAINGQGANVATYTFNGITPGIYRVSATWRGDTNRATNSPFAVYDGAALLGTVIVNQQQQPSGLVDKSLNWKDLGNFTISGTSLIVKLSDNANQYVDADAIRIERVGDLVVGPRADLLLSGQHLPSGLLDFGTTQPGVPLQRTLTVTNVGTTALHLGAIGAVPAGFSLVNGFGATTLAPGSSTTFTVQFDAGANGIFTGPITFASDDVSSATYAFTLKGTAATVVVPVVQIIDDGNAGFTTQGNWGSSVETGRYVGDDHHYATGGAGSNVAIYTFTGITPGVYRVSATWRGDTNRGLNTPFTVFDGASALGTARINQQFFPQTLIDQGFPYQDIGTTWTITGSTLVVKISDDIASGLYADVDAVRIERVGNLILGPEIQVLDGATDLAAGTSTVAFGSTIPGTPVQKTLTVKNIGTATLTLGAIASLPAGFTLVNGFGSTTLAPGTSTTFVVKLDGATLGNYSGQVSFINDDTDEGPFTFNISGSVVPPPPAPGAPTGLTLTPGNSQLGVKWNAVAGATSYTLKYGTTPGGPYAITVTGLTGLSTTILPLTNEVTYYFVISATGLGGEGANSAQVSAKPSATSIIDFNTGFANAGTALTYNSVNGAGHVTGNALILLDNAGSQSSSVYATLPQNITGFSTEFDFQLTGTWPIGEGFTFVMQRAGIHAIGRDGGGLGYGAATTDKTSPNGSGGIATSAAVKFDLFDNQGEGNGSTGLYLNGEAPTSPHSVSLGAAGFDLRSYHPIRASITYDGTVLSVTLLDLVNNSTVTQTYVVDLAASIGGDTAWVGFTASTGHETTSAQITRWMFTSIPSVPKPPAAPTGLTATPGNSQVVLNWTASFNATGYKLKYGSISGGPYTVVDVAAGTTATVTGLNNGNTYYFAVSAVNSVGEGANSVESSTAPFALPAPAAPGGVTASAGNGQVLLNWGAVSGATSYNVKYGTDSGGPYTTVIAAVTGTSFNVTPLTNETQYYFVVTAQGLGGESVASTQVTAKPSATALPINFGSGLAGAASALTINSLTVNGGATISGNDLVLSNGGQSTTTSVYDNTQQHVNTFTTQFDFTMTGTWPLGDGFTFVIQRAGLNAIGVGGAGLGYGAAAIGQTGGIANSVAIKFDVFDSQGEGNNSTGLYVNGAAPTSLGAINLGASGFDLRSYNTIRCTMTYDGTTLTVVLKDLVNGATATQKYTIDIPTVIGGNLAWVGFTSASGHMTNVNHVQNWTFNGT